MADVKPLVLTGGIPQEISSADTLVVPGLKLSDDVQIGTSGNTDWLYLGQMNVTGGGQSNRLFMKLYGGDWTDAGEIDYVINTFGQTSSSTGISIRRVRSAWYAASGEIFSNIEFKCFRNDGTQDIEVYVRMTTVDYVSLYASVVRTNTSSASIIKATATAVLPTTGYTELTVTLGEEPTVQLASSVLIRNNTLPRSTLYDYTDPTQVTSITYDGTSVLLANRLRLTTSTVDASSLNIPVGVAPTSPGSGDVWNDGSYLMFRNNTGTRYLTTTVGMTTQAIPKAGGAGIFQNSLLKDTGTEIRQESGLHRFYNPSLTSYVLACTGGTEAAPDSASAYVLRMDGYMEWGAGGSNVRDTNLYRASANVLKTDDIFDVGIDLRVAGTPRITAGGAATMATVSAANLTLDRLVTVGASGLLTDDGGLYTTKSSSVTRSLTVGTGAAVGAPIQIIMDGIAGQSKIVRARTGSVHRWGMGADSSDNFVIEAYNDGGGLLDYPIAINRASGGDITIGGGTSRPIVIAGTSRIRFATDLDFYKSGDGAAVHFKTPASGTCALIPETTTASLNAALGTSSYRWRGVYANVIDASTSISAPALAATNLTPGRVVYVGASDILVDDSAFLFDSVKKDFGVGVDRTIVGSTSAVSEAAEILIASGAYMSGLYELRFDHTNRVERLWFRLNCQAYQDQPIITVVQYFSYNNAKCFGTIRVRRSADSATMYLTVTVSNLNGGTGGINVVAKTLDAAAPTGFTIGGTLPGSTVSLKSLTPDDVVGYKSTSGADFVGAVVAQGGVTAYGTSSVAAYWHVGQGAFDATRISFASKASGDLFSRWLVKEDGLTEWGAGGSNVRDTNLYRSAANVLKTDDSFVVGAGLTVTGTTTLATSLSGLLKATAGVVSAATAADVTGQLLTGYTVGANTALAATDSILGAFGKVQGQINARVSGTGSANRVAYFSGTSTLTTDSSFLYSTTVSNILNVGANAAKNSYIDITTGSGYEAKNRYYGTFYQRWGAGLNASVGYEISAHDALGALIDYPISIVNASGGAISIGGSTARPTTFSGLVTASTGLDVGTSSQSWIRNGGGGGLYMGYGSSKTDYRFYCYGDNAGIVSQSAGAHVAAFQVSTTGSVGTARVLGDVVQLDNCIGTRTRAVVANEYGQLSATAPLPKMLLAGSYSANPLSGGADVSLGSFTIAAGEMSDAGGSLGLYRHANVELKLMSRGSTAFGINVKLKKNGTTFKTISIPFTAFDQGGYVKFGLTTLSGVFNTIRVDPIETFYQPGPVWDMEPTFSGFDADSTVSNTYEIAVAASGGDTAVQYTLNAQLF